MPLAMQKSSSSKTFFYRICLLLPYFVSEELYQCLERMRLLILNRAAVRIQAAVRMFLCQRHWPQLSVSLRQARLQGEAQSKIR